jgi:hypothetical protein
LAAQAHIEAEHKSAAHNPIIGQMTGNAAR